MRHLLYFVVMAAAMMGLASFLPGFHVDSMGQALLAALVLGVANTVLKPILFVLTLPFTILTLGLFLLALNAMMLWLTDLLVPGLRIDGAGPLVIASLALAVVGMVWKAASKSFED